MGWPTPHTDAHRKLESRAHRAIRLRLHATHHGTVMGPKPKPLQEPCAETTANGVTKKHWGFGGQPLYQHDVDALTKKGVDWEKDIMPDGRLKHPKYRLRRIANR